MFRCFPNCVVFICIYFYFPLPLQLDKYNQITAQYEAKRNTIKLAIPSISIKRETWTEL